MQKELALQKRLQRHSSYISLIIFLAAVAAAALLLNILSGGHFLSGNNVQVVLSNSVYPSFVSWGLCFLFACGYTDLSIGGVVILSAYATCAFGNLYGFPGVILGGLLTGTALVFINFSIFAFTKIPSWIASISLALIYEAAAVFLRTNSATKPHVDVLLNEKYLTLGKFPINVIVLIIGFILVYVLYNGTSVGLNIRAVGGNESVSKALGVNVLKTLLFVGLICGLLIGTAGFLKQSLDVKTFALSGLNTIQLIFKPLAIVLLAQILSRWINIVIAVPFCSIIIYSIFNVMTYFGVPSGTLQDVLLCAFLIIFGVGGQRGVKEVVK